MASGTSEPAPLRFGPFVAGRRIAIGGMAEVFEARRAGETGPARFVVKVLLPQYAHDPDFVAALRHEAELARVLAHPNLVAVVDVGIEGDQTWLAMERVDGPTLAELTQALREDGERGRALPADLAVHVVRELVRALSCVHDATTSTGEPLHIVHRDVTPQNVLVSRAGEVRLGDFGIARSGLRDGRTRTGVIKGKLAYLAPEQATGSAVDARTDLYAAGVILWELLARAPYLAGATELELLRAAEEPRFRPAGTEDRELETLLERMLRRFPEERPARAGAVLEVLEAWLVRAGASDRTAALAALVVKLFGPGEPAAERTRLPPPSVRARSPMALALVVGAAVVGGGAWMLGRAPGVVEESPDPPVASSARDAGAPPTALPVASRPPSTDAGTQASPSQPEVREEPVLAPPARAVGSKGVISLGDRARPPRPPLAARPAAGLGGVTPPSLAVPTAGARPASATLAARVAAVRAQLRARGLGLEDLAEPDRTALRAIESALDAGRLAEVEAALPSLERAASAAHLDADPVRRKLERVDAALRAARREGRDTSALDELAASALQSHLDGRLEETNRRLDQILARLRAPR